jgi:hypothetical protein
MTRLTIENGDQKISVEIPTTEPSPREMFELFRVVFLGSTFTWEQWEEEIITIYEHQF